MTASRCLPPSALAFSGWLGAALVNGVEICLLPAGRGGFSARAAHLAFDFGQTLALGVVAAALTGAWTLLRPARPVWTYLAGFVVSLGFGAAVLPEDLDGAAERWGRALGQNVVLWLGVVVLALVPLLCFAAGRLAARSRFAAVGVLAALVVLASNSYVLVNGYHGGHAWIAGSGATLLGAALGSPKLESWLAERLNGRAGLGVAMLVVSAAAASVVPDPPSRARLALLERDTALLAPWLSRFHARPKRKLRKVAIPPELKPWYASRAKRPEVAPSPERLLPNGPIVVLVTIDALRLEVLGSEADRIAPTLAEIRRRGVYFSQARSSGSDTRFSLATLFTGRHLSMLKWSDLSRARPTLENDRLPRLPELLGRGNVATVTGVSLPGMLVPSIGIVRGFDEEFVKDATVGKHGTEQVIDQAIERLKRHGSGPLFYYTHLVDPHAPYYKHGSEKLPPHAAYLDEVRYADGHLGRLRRAIHDLGLASRTALIVSSDHGEGFGEHGLRYHNKPLYEVMVHVPLIVELPSVEPRVVSHHVSLMDVGATVLDLLRVPRPGYWMSESLVPLLVGQEPDPQRPIFMERPREQALLFGDGIKVLLRSRPSSEEIYDLGRDPNEQENLRDSLGAEGDRRVALTRAYASAHANSMTEND